MSEHKENCDWRSATDKKSGRVYYYNVKTRATTWNKPLELATPEERIKMIAEKEATEKFFREMESNILKRIEKAFREDEEKRFYEHIGRSSTDDAVDDERTITVVGKKKVVTYGVDPPTTVIGVNMGKSRGRLGSDGSFDDGNSARVVVLDDDTEPTPLSSKPRNSVRFNDDLEQLELLRETSSELLYEASEGRSRCNSLSGPARRVRTISTIDDEILMTMGKTPPADITTVHPNRHSSMFIPTSHASNVNPLDIAESKYEREMASSPLLGMKQGAKELGNRVSGRYPVVPKQVDAKDLLDAMDKKDVTSPSKKPRFSERLKRRNSTGTIYLNNTMSQQNNDATIECVCVVIRAHMIDAAREGVEPITKYNVFKDPLYMKDKKDEKDDKDDIARIPSLSIVKEFFMYVFSKSQLESDCIIMALIYCERLVKETKGRLCIRYDNWRSILFSCLVMASKVWDDLSMWNVDFSQVYPTFNLLRVNELELAMLDALKYSIRVSASEYAKYYFHLRSMMTRLGFDESTDVQPLDIYGAKKLQLSTEKYLAEVDTDKQRRRVHSVHVDLSSLDMQRGKSVEVTMDAGGSAKIMRASPKHHTVQLEQLIHADHTDADGAMHLSSSSNFYGNLRSSSNAGSFKATKNRSPSDRDMK